MHNAEQARLSLALLLTLRGTPFLYNGEDIGMTDLYLTEIRQFRDLLGVWYYQAQVKDLGLAPEEALEKAARLTRDKNRTPMQWSQHNNGGFCPADVQPWLPVNPNYSTGVNVQDQAQDPESLLYFCRHMLRVRKNTPALIAGSYKPYHPMNRKVLAFFRQIPGQTCLVVLNFSGLAAGLVLPKGSDHLHVLYSSHLLGGDVKNGKRIRMAPFGIAIFTLEQGDIG